MLGINGKLLLVVSAADVRTINDSFRGNNTTEKQRSSQRFHVKAFCLHRSVVNEVSFVFTRALIIRRTECYKCDFSKGIASDHENDGVSQM